MVTISKSEKVKIGLTGSIILVELRGLSTDEKPTVLNNKKIENGSIFIEIDTGDIYCYDLENETWYKI